MSAEALRRPSFLPPNIHGRALDKEVLVKGFGHLMGNTIHFQASHRSQYKGEWTYGLSTLGYLQDYKSTLISWEYVSINGTVGFIRRGTGVALPLCLLAKCAVILTVQQAAAVSSHDVEKRSRID